MHPPGKEKPALRHAGQSLNKFDIKTVSVGAAQVKQRLDLWAAAALVGVSLPERPGIKFGSPFRPDIHPSCELWRTLSGEVVARDRSTGETFDAIAFYARARGITNGAAIRELADRLNLTPLSPAVAVTPKPKVDKAARRKSWQPFESGTAEDLAALSQLRHVSPESLGLVGRRGLLLFANFPEGRAWIVTDSTRRNAQARLLTGSPWPATATRGETKAWTMPGSIAAWPIGLPEAEHFPAVALVEGTPDFISVLHHALCEGTERRIAPVMLAGASLRIPDDALPHFNGKCVRIFVHDDEKGHEAARRWAGQLQAIGCAVDGFDFSGLLRDDGAPVTDLNDLCRLDVDSWEAHRDIVENSMSLALPGGN